MTARSRQNTPVTQNAYKHYAAHLRGQAQAERCCAELLVNAVLVRGTLSVPVRNALAAGTFPFLRVGVDSEGCTEIINLNDLDKFVWQSGGDMFGTFIEPQRSRRTQLGDAGLWALYADVINAASVAEAIAKDFCEQLCPTKFLHDIRKKVKGYDGTGFRTKEVLVDILDNSHLFLDEAAQKKVHADYKFIAVMGVGPQRACNWLFNKPFLYLMDLSLKQRQEHFLPALKYTVKRLQVLFPTTYGQRTFLGILYELCEFNKWLKAVYTPYGYIYVPTDCADETAETLEAVMTLENFRALRELSVPFHVHTRMRFGAKR